MRSWALQAAAILLAGCGSQDRPAPDVSSDSTVSAPKIATDSLALKLTGGGEVWFTDARTDTDSLGHSCFERVLEIRREGGRIPVPLLYTGEPPVQVDPATIRARVWLKCRPMDRYDVDLKSGRPTRAR